MRVTGENPNLNSDVSIKIPNTIRRGVIAILIAIALFAIAVLFITSLTYFRSIEIEEAKSRLSLYGRSLNSTLEQFQYLSAIHFSALSNCYFRLYR